MRIICITVGGGGGAQEDIVIIIITTKADGCVEDEPFDIESRVWSLHGDCCMISSSSYVLSL